MTIMAMVRKRLVFKTTIHNGKRINQLILIGIALRTLLRLSGNNFRNVTAILLKPEIFRAFPSPLDPRDPFYLPDRLVSAMKQQSVFLELSPDTEEKAYAAATVICNAYDKAEHAREFRNWYHHSALSRKRRAAEARLTEAHMASIIK